MNPALNSDQETEAVIAGDPAGNSNPTVLDLDNEAAVLRKRLRRGVSLILGSFVIGYPLAAAAWAAFGARTAAYVYLASWVPFILGFVIGGKPALNAAKEQRKRFFRRRKPRSSKPPV